MKRKPNIIRMLICGIIFPISFLTPDAAKSVNRNPFPVVGNICYNKDIPPPDSKIFPTYGMCFISRSKVILSYAFGEGHQIDATWQVHDSVISFRSLISLEIGPGNNSFDCKIIYLKIVADLLLDCDGAYSEFTGVWRLDKSSVIKLPTDTKREK